MSTPEPREIIETVPTVVWSTAPDGEPTFINQRAIDYTGCRFADLLNLGWRQFIHPDHFPETLNAFYHSIQTGGSYQSVHRLRRADGQYRWHRARAEPLRDKQRRIIQWYGVSVDIEDDKKAESELRATQAQLSRASRAATAAGRSASIAHEINQPLAGILASAETCRTLLAGNNPNLPRARAAIERIITNSNAVADIVRRIPDVSRQTPPANASLRVDEEIDEISRGARDEFVGRHGLDDRLLRRVLDYVDEHLFEEIAVVDLANVACLSIFHFTRLFSSAMGVSPRRYVSQRRLELAKAIVAAGGMSVADAAFICGFSSQSSFGRAFRRATGMTPMEYRRAFGSR